MRLSQKRIGLGHFLKISYDQLFSAIRDSDILREEDQAGLDVIIAVVVEEAT